MEQSHIQTNGVNLNVIQAGPQDGQPVILMHGFPEFWRGWQKQIAPLAEAGFRVIVPDQRGYNLSDKPRPLSAYQVDVLAADIIGLMDALGCEKAIITGHDWGGVVAWITAALHPERVEKLAVLNAPYVSVMPKTALRHPEQLVRSSYAYFFQIPGLPEAIMRSNDCGPLAEMLQRSSRPGTFSEEDLEAYRAAWWRKGALTSMINWYRALVRRPVKLPAAPTFEMPVLLLWGKQDIALIPELAEASIALCPNGRLEFFEDASHWLQHEEAEAVSAKLIEFFRG